MVTNGNRVWTINGKFVQTRIYFVYSLSTTITPTNDQTSCLQVMWIWLQGVGHLVISFTNTHRGRYLCASSFWNLCCSGVLDFVKINFSVFHLFSIELHNIYSQLWLINALHVNSRKNVNTYKICIPYVNNLGYLAQCSTVYLEYFDNARLKTSSCSLKKTSTMW